MLLLKTWPGMNISDASRTVLRVSGPESRNFLQNLVTNDIGKLSDGLVYAALLTPQGKYLFDFFLLSGNEDILLDVKADAAPELLKRLALYRLRAKVDLEMTEIKVVCGLGPMPPDALSDPRHPDLGWRLYGCGLPAQPEADWDRLRVTYCIPETGIELIPEKTFILETGFERLSGVDFRKGCFVGQEVTARMKHKAVLRRQLKTVLVDGSAETGAEITDSGRSVGRLYSQAQGKGLALLRLDRIKSRRLQAGDAVIHLL